MNGIKLKSHLERDLDHLLVVRWKGRLTKKREGSHYRIHRKNLMVGEKVVYHAKLHWIVFLWAAFFLFFAIIGFANGSGAVGGLFIFLAALAGFFSFISYSTSEFGVTNKRVLVKVGWIRRHSLETLLTKVEGIGVDQGILGRILGYGTIVVTGTGGTKEPFHKIDAPLEFRKRVQEQIAVVQESK